MRVLILGLSFLIGCGDPVDENSDGAIDGQSYVVDNSKKPGGSGARPGGPRQDGGAPQQEDGGLPSSHDSGSPGPGPVDAAQGTREESYYHVTRTMSGTGCPTTQQVTSLDWDWVRRPAMDPPLTIAGSEYKPAGAIDGRYVGELSGDLRVNGTGFDLTGVSAKRDISIRATYRYQGTKYLGFDAVETSAATANCQWKLVGTLVE